jgi:hypothetical protein
MHESERLEQFAHAGRGTGESFYGFVDERGRTPVLASLQTFRAQLDAKAA